MSKFIDAIRDKFTGQHRAIFPPLSVSIQKDPLSIDQYDELLVYKYGVKWSVDVASREEDRPHVMANVIRELKYVIYGDLEEKIILLERAIYEHDERTALNLVREVLKEIS